MMTMINDVLGPDGVLFVALACAWGSGWFWRHGQHLLAVGAAAYPATLAIAVALIEAAP